MFLYAHGVNVAERDPEYRAVLAKATHLFADGIGMRLASLAAGTPLLDNVNGTDLFPLLCRALQGTGIRVYCLGSMPGVTERVKERAAREYPGLAICGTYHGFFEKSSEECKVIASIRAARADLVLVGMGVPHQEKWLFTYLEETGARVGIAVGGVFDVYSGKIWRPPVWMRRLGLEWFGRLIPGLGEPRRLWKRYLVGNFVFLFHAGRWAWTVRRQLRA
jgi:N-acetylglucosaminyldiphosphoundecaprenol N-acetyl-beta-D-mannosaminyltransferase